MKKWLALGLVLVLAFSLAACGAVEKPTFRDVLLGDGTFWYDSGEITLNAFMEQEDELAQIFYVTALDMDGDGEEEAILQIIPPAGDLGGYLVLHREKNRILGFRFPLKYLSQMKTDGSFFYISASESGVATLSFEGENAALVKQCRGVGENFMVYECTVDGKEATAEAFDAALTAQGQKEDAPWLDFSEDSIEKLFPEK